MNESAFPKYRYLGLDELGDARHLVVDGAPRNNTSMVLSHWPISPTPIELWRDLSAEIVCAYLLDEKTWDLSTDIVTNDHLDIDGLISLYFLTNPERALERADFLVDVARVGDFGVIRSSEAGEVAWILGALIQAPELAVVDLVDSAVTPGRTTTVSYRAMLAVLERIIDAPERFETILRGPRERFLSTMEEIARGSITLEEHQGSDLCVVHVSETAGIDDSSNCIEGVPIGIDSAAVHSSTTASRILVCRDSRYVYYDRYETWVRFVSERHQLRRDLGRFATELNQMDRVPWVAGQPSTLVPVLHHGNGASSLSSDRFVAELVEFLSSTEPAWDPFESR